LLVLEKDPEILPEPGSGTAVITEYRPGQVGIRTEADSAKLLFLSDAYSGGWKAFIDGNETEILRADYVFRAVSVPPGTHTVIFRYHPDSFRFGAYLSLASLIVTGLVFFRYRYENRYTQSIS
jgi:uncharacterized membrane protein YfhO